MFRIKNFNVLNKTIIFLASFLILNIFSWSSKVNNLLALTGYDPEYGARPIKRKIRNVIEDQISELIITNKVKDGNTISLNVVDNNINIDVR